MKTDNKRTTAKWKHGFVFNKQVCDVSSIPSSVWTEVDPGRSLILYTSFFPGVKYRLWSLNIECCEVVIDHTLLWRLEVLCFLFIIFLLK